jgi:hypothetical protein
VNGRLLLLRLHLPATVRRSILRDLLGALARAFERERPSTIGLSADELNDLVVERSSTWAEEALAAGGDLTGLQRRLFVEAAALGRRAKVRLRIRSEADGLAGARVIYRAIGIDFRPRSPYEVIVPRCAFARAYRPAVCRLMSSMDSGLIAGLTDGNGLRFTMRLTEGAALCRARVLHAPEVR